MVPTAPMASYQADTPPAMPPAPPAPQRQAQRETAMPTVLPPPNRAARPTAYDQSGYAAKGQKNDINEYTTPLDVSSIPREVQEHAARVAAEIEGTNDRPAQQEHGRSNNNYGDGY